MTVTKPEITAENVKSGWQEFTVVRTYGSAKALRLPAKFQLISAPWNHVNAQMPEKKRLLMTMEYGPPTVQPQPLCIMDVGLVKWRVSNKPVNADRTIRNSPIDSDLRTRFDPSLY